MVNKKYKIFLMNDTLNNFMIDFDLEKPQFSPSSFSDTGANKKHHPFGWCFLLAIIDAFLLNKTLQRVLGEVRSNSE